MSNKVKFGNQARSKIVEGINLAGDSVRPTLGARGKNIIIEMVQGGSLIVNDGVSVLRNLDPKDNEVNMGVGLVREGSAQSEEEAGDGTTTVSILIQAMVNNGIKYISAGTSSVDLKNGMKKAGDLLTSLIKEDAITIDKDDKRLIDVATVSANNDAELGKLIAELFSRVGKEGVIDVQNSNDNTTKISDVEGAEYDRGFISPYFTNNNARDKAILSDSYVLVTDHRIDSSRDLLPILDKINRKAPLLIFSDDISEDAMGTLTLNQSQGLINICCVKAPGIGDDRIDNLRDIAAITGATYINSGMQMKLGEDVSIDMLGKCDKSVIDQKSTKIVGGYGDEDAINQIIDGLRQRINEEEDSYKESKLNQRLSRMLGGVSVIYVGAPTETELEEKKLRIDDAIQATRAALSDGILPGGGIMLASYTTQLKNLVLENDGEMFGVRVVMEAIKDPFLQIMENAGLSGEVILEKVMSKSKTYGYDVRAMEYCDMVERGIIDPAKVTKSAIDNSISISSMVLTTEVLISEIKDNE
jgi:chaperonin GroEL